MLMCVVAISCHCIYESVEVLLEGACTQCIMSVFDSVTGMFRVQPPKNSCETTTVCWYENTAAEQ